MQRVLAFDDTPPLSLPLRFFASAPVFALLAAALLLWQGPDAFSSRWSGATLAATHLFTLGVLSMTMVGALLQILPVVAGVAVVRPRLSASIIHTLLSTGTLTLALAFLTNQPWLFKLALPQLALALCTLLGACAEGLWHARASGADATVRGIRIALGALLPTLVVGATLAGALAWSLPVPLMTFTELHVLWGVFGWIGALVIGVAFQVIPMFQVTELYPRALTEVLGAALLALLLACSVALLAGHWSLPLLEALLLLIFVSFAVVTLRLLARRKRPAPDATTMFWRLAMASLLAGAVLWFAPPDSAARALLLGILFLLGFAYSAVLGMLYKIVPFLLWQHWQGSPGGRPVASIRLVIPDAVAVRQFKGHLAALLLLCAATVWPALLSRLGALALLASSLQLAYILLRTLRLQPAY